MRRIAVGLLLVVAGIACHDSLAAADCQDGAGTGSIADNGLYNSGVQTPACPSLTGDPLRPESTMRIIHDVREEPSICQGTPDALLEVYRRWDLTTGERLPDLQNCMAPQVPLPPGVPLPPSALEVFRSAVK